MIKLLRVDHRLLHGQVAFSWTQGLGADCILIANDDVVKDEVKKTTIKLAKPQGVKLVVKSIDDSIAALKSGVTDKYKLFIIVESIQDVYKLVKSYPKIQHINIGGTKPTSETENISKAVNVTKKEKALLNELLSDELDIFIQMVPSDRKTMVKPLIN